MIKQLELEMESFVSNLSGEELELFFLETKFEYYNSDIFKSVKFLDIKFEERDDNR